MARQAAGLLIVATTIGFLCLLDYPAVFGRWEIYAMTRMVSGTGPGLTLEIGPVGPIHGGVPYGLPDLGYYTAAWLGWTLTAFRLPVLLAGVGVSFVFFILARRNFGFWAAVVGTLALVLNPMFLVYWHQLFVPMFSMLFLLMLIDRAQWLETDLQSRQRLFWGVLTLAVVYFFVLLHYGPGRVYGTVVVGYWAIRVVWRAIAARRHGRPVNRASLVAVPACIALVIAIAVFLDQRNVRYLVDPLRLIVSPRTEFVRSADEISIVRQNVPIIATAFAPFLDLAPGRFGDYISDLIVDYRSYVIPTSMLPLAFIGLGVVVAQARWAQFSRLTLLLLTMTVVAPVLSSEYDGYLTISSPRMFFAQIPLYLCVAAAVGWLLSRKRAITRFGTAALLLAVLAFQAVTVSMEIDRHRAFMNDLADRWTSNLDPSLFVGRAAQRATDADQQVTNGNYRYYVDFGSIGSRAIAQRIIAGAPRPRNPNQVVVVLLDGVFARGNTAVPIQVVFELREQGIDAAWYDTSNDVMRGSVSTSPSLIVVTQEAADRRVRERLRRSDVPMSRWTLSLPD